MNKLNELNLQSHKNKLPEKPSEESTRKWLAGMEECWQEFLRLHASGHFPDVSTEDLQKFIAGDDSVIDKIRNNHDYIMKLSNYYDS